MRIWFELTNSPHINMFAAMIRDLEHEHEVIITCRPLANTIDLLDLHGFKYKVVGMHYGGKLAAKLFGFPVRVLQLVKYLFGKKVDIAISQSSFHSPVVARLLGISSIYMNDNEHAMGNIPAFICANTILVPEYLGIDKLKKQYANPAKVLHYPGVKEGIYLWELEKRLALKKTLSNHQKPRPVVYVRPEPWTAQYYTGSRNFMDDLLLGMKDSVDIVLLPRGKEQGVHYQSSKFNGIRVVTTALDIADIAPDCDLFIGAGGTMTREMAVLGIPTISVYQDELLDVDRHLLDVGAFSHMPSLTAEQALEFLADAKQRPADKRLLEKGEAAYDLIKRTIFKN
jgi:predicted glycosyltransferase